MWHMIGNDDINRSCIKRRVEDLIWIVKINGEGKLIDASKMNNNHCFMNGKLLNQQESQ